MELYKNFSPYNYGSNWDDYSLAHPNRQEKIDSRFNGEVNKFAQLIQFVPSFEDLENNLGGINKMENNNNHNFVRKVDVKPFKDNEIAVKVVGNEVTVNGNHEEKTDKFGFISRSFERKYEIPSECDIEKFRCELEPNGILLIEAPIKVEQNPERSTETPIIHEKCVESTDVNSLVEENKNESKAIDNEMLFKKMISG